MGLEIGKTSLAIADRIAFFRTLGSWLGSGGGQTAVADAVRNTTESFSYDEYKTLRHKMELIEREYSSGQTPLYVALEQADLGFANHELAVIKAGEESNQLRDAVPSLVAALDIQHTGRRLLVSSLSTPLIMGFVLILMMLGVLVFMIPIVVEPIITRKPEALAKFPAIIQWVWYASLFVRGNAVGVSMVAGFPVAVLVFQKVPIVAKYIAKFFMWFRPTWRLITTFNAVLLVYFLPAFARSGMPSPQVLSALSECVTHPHFAGLLRAASEVNRTGSRMGEAVKPIPVRTSFTNAVSMGEQTGALADRVEELQEPYALEMKRAIGQVASTLKVIVMGVLFPLFIVVAYTSLVAPIFALLEY